MLQDIAICPEGTSRFRRWKLVERYVGACIGACPILVRLCYPDSGHLRHPIRTTPCTRHCLWGSNGTPLFADLPTAVPGIKGGHSTDCADGIFLPWSCGCACWQMLTHPRCLSVQKGGSSRGKHEPPEVVVNDMDPSGQQHLSLSKTVTLRAHEIEPFVQAVQETVKSSRW